MVKSVGDCAVDINECSVASDDSRGSISETNNFPQLQIHPVAAQVLITQKEPFVKLCRMEQDMSDCFPVENEPIQIQHSGGCDLSVEKTTSVADLNAKPVGQGDNVNNILSSCDTDHNDDPQADGIVDSADVITSTMLEEETKLFEEGKLESARLHQEALDQWQEISEDLRMTQLNHLLEKSSIYANYLLDVIEKSKEKKKRKALKKEQQKLKNLDDKENVKALSSDVSQKKESVNTTTRSRGAKRKSEPVVAMSQKRSRRLNEKKQREACADHPDPDFVVGQKVEILKKQKNEDEDLLPAKIVDSCYLNQEWKYLVHYHGTSKSKNEWVKKSVVVADIDMDDDDGVNDKQRKQNYLSALHKQVSKIDKEALFKLKFHTGTASDTVVEVIDGVKYLNGQVIPDAQPALLTGGILRDYQVVGYEWLKILFSNAVNGILADEMGLGKTIQCIALFCRLIKLGFQGPFIVCAPMSTICNWLSEFKRFAPSLSVMLYHGSAAERQVLSEKIGHRSSLQQHFPIVVTSYEILMRDRHILGRHTWEYLVVDEGHRLKNMNCRLLKELKMLKVNAKLLLTGTPLQNDLAELWSLLNFLLPEVFNDLGTFQAWFDLTKIQKGAQSVTSDKERNVVAMLHKILAPFVLRRTKADVDIALPPKRELLVFAPLSTSQNDFYQALTARTIRKYLKKNADSEGDEQVSSTEKVEEDFFSERQTRSSTVTIRCAREREERNDLIDDSDVNISLNNVMMQLRKCCNHPYLLQYPLVPGTDFYRIDEELISSCGKMQLLDRMLPRLQEAGHKVLIFSQMTKLLDILEDYCRFRSFAFVRLDGSTQCQQRQNYIDQYNSDPGLFVFLLSTRAGGLGINLAAADTVIIYDSDWNPQNDLQAQDRCHRIGQTRPVVVYRFVSAGTVDQFMVERAEAKRVLERLIMNRSKFKGKLAEDIKSENDGIANVSTKVLTMLQASTNDEKRCKPISDDDLQTILDRQAVMSCAADDVRCGLFRTLD